MKSQFSERAALQMFLLERCSISVLDSDGSALVFAMPSSRVRDSRHHWEGPFDGQLGFRSVAATGYRPQKQSDPVMGSRLTRLRRPNMQNVCLDQILLT